MAGQSPRSVSIQAGIAVGLLTLLAVGVALWANNVGGQWWLPPLSGLVVGAVCYMLVYRQLGVYIQDRVRIIYKTIRRFKGSSSNLNLDMNNDIVEQVNRDVSLGPNLKLTKSPTSGKRTRSGKSSSATWPMN